MSNRVGVEVAQDDPFDDPNHGDVLISGVKWFTKGAKPPTQSDNAKMRNIGTFVGGVVPSLVNIMNIVFWTRLPYVIGSEGGLAVITGLFGSFLLVLVTVFSLSAFATNGELQAGGSYNMISRTVGAEVGSGCGLALSLASIVGASSAGIGIAETIVQLYAPYAVFGDVAWDIRAYSMILTIVMGLLGPYVFEIRTFAFFALWVGVAGYGLGLIFPSVADTPAGCSVERFKTNWEMKSDIDITNAFATFSIIFPSFGGILAASNSSGRLKRPQESIPTGSIIALILGTVVYIMTAFALTGCHDSAQLDEMASTVMQDSSIFMPFVFIALCSASLGRGITGLAAGPVILQAMAMDGLLPAFLRNWPRVCATICSTLLCLWGDLNAISSFSSVMFLVVFTIINHGLFLAKGANAPSFRPHFHFYNPWASLIVAGLCVISMFLMSWEASLLSWIVILIMYWWVKQSRTKNHWGAISDSRSYNNALKEALKLRHVMKHPKLYRPNMALFIDGEAKKHTETIALMEHIHHGQGMAIVISVFPPEWGMKKLVRERNNKIVDLRTGDCVFYEVIASKSKCEAMKKVMLLTGLGALRPNIVLIEFDESLSEGVTEFVREVLERQRSLIILRKPMLMAGDFGTIDCWCMYSNGGLCLLIAASVARGNRKMRVLTFASTDKGKDPAVEKERIQMALKRYRVNAEVIVLPIDSTVDVPSKRSESIWQELVGDKEHEDTAPERTRRYKLWADAIAQHSAHSLITVISLPKPKRHQSYYIYMRWIALLSVIPSSVLFVRGNGEATLSSDV